MRRAVLLHFLQTDPILFQAGDVNVYRYVKNRVTRLTDPLGLEGWGQWQPPASAPYPTQQGNQNLVNGLQQQQSQLANGMTGLAAAGAVVATAGLIADAAAVGALTEAANLALANPATVAGLATAASNFIPGSSPYPSDPSDIWDVGSSAANLLLDLINDLMNNDGENTNSNDQCP